jgi:hypothetical protein
MLFFSSPAYLALPKQEQGDGPIDDRMLVFLEQHACDCLNNAVAIACTLISDEDNFHFKTLASFREELNKTKKSLLLPRVIGPSKFERIPLSGPFASNENLGVKCLENMNYSLLDVVETYVPRDFIPVKKAVESSLCSRDPSIPPAINFQVPISFENPVSFFTSSSSCTKCMQRYNASSKESFKETPTLPILQARDHLQHFSTACVGVEKEVNQKGFLIALSKVLPLPSLEDKDSHTAPHIFSSHTDAESILFSGDNPLSCLPGFVSPLSQYKSPPRTPPRVWVQAAPLLGLVSSSSPRSHPSVVTGLGPKPGENQAEKFFGTRVEPM